MRECGPGTVRIGCARRPGSRASIDRPVAGTRWQSARTPNTRGHAGREDGSVRAEGAGAHLWDHHDHLQRPDRPPSRQPESLGCCPQAPAKYGLARPQHLGLVRPSKSRFRRMDGHVGHALRAWLGVPFAPSRSGPAKPTLKPPLKPPFPICSRH